MKAQTVLVGIASVATVAFLAAAWMLTHKPALHGAVIDPPMQAADINLQDTGGQQFSLSSQQGKVLLLYFGYTNCPDECPLTMAHLKLAVDSLGDQGKDVQVAMITTDPKRDTPQALRTFLSKFSPDFIGLLGTTDQLAKVWKDYGVAVEDSGETHSFFVYVIDKRGNFRETFLPDSPTGDIADDLRLLLAER